MVLAERKLIERIRRMAGAGRNRALLRGIGDDCAILRPPRGSELLVTTDLCIEDVHFRRKWHPSRSIGHRCLTRGLSDIAAMAGEPLACFLSLGLPPKLPQAWVDDFMRGLLQLSGKFKIPLAGGDISSADKIMADILVLGYAPAGAAVQRGGACSGDRIYVTGELGGSASILQKLYAGRKVAAKKSSRHFYPIPRLQAARWLRQKKIPSAMIDLSDGLSVDLAHICEESRVSAAIYEENIPVARGAEPGLALHGGEDYELLFTAPASSKVPSRIAGVPVTLIGEVHAGVSGGPHVQIFDKSGRHQRLRPAGWQHFREI